ncbi:unnamed protein product [Kuraishia capsulata CBS 1993]|uniref:TECPR1-like DysF domain-containing protein n=1 Tax=Kuraishia capsulata CBS 1993 TaxID=1382522 RepID=W6MLU0_9ASCO|nr:uncharacterized protein KUCA_T00003467001 [Kuraishia capsulata CBS 1993]CDK27489.1 unnamed protein product [Kuraishia capsulata CBS 1993]
MDSVVNNLFSSWDSMVSSPGESKSKPEGHQHNHHQHPHGWHRRAGSNGAYPTSSNSPTSSKAGDTKHKASSSLLPDFFGSMYKAEGAEAVPNSSVSSQLTDKVVERLLSMALPPSSGSVDIYEGIMERIEMQKARPPFSVPLMSKNFIQLNSRLSVPFELIDEVIKVFSWSHPTYTLSVLLIVSHLILRPILLLSVPAFYIAFNIMVPAYLKRHPPEKNNDLKNNPVPAYGPSLIDIETPKPVPELSREFYLNITDLQNHMVLYVVAYDMLNYLVVNYCYFKDEPISSFLFLVLTGVGIFTMTFVTTLAPFMTAIKLVSLCLIWSTFVALHTSNRNRLLAYLYSEETRIKLLTITNSLEQKISKEFKYKEEKEVREIEIFELQTLDPESKNWQLVCYSNELYAPNSPTRLNRLPLDGTLSLRNIKPPLDWRFLPTRDIAHSSSTERVTAGLKENAVAVVSPTASSFSEASVTSDPKTTTQSQQQTAPVSLQTNGWTLDLTPKEWVSANNLLELLDIDDDEKWCYDVVIPYAQGSSVGIGKKPNPAFPRRRGDFRRRRWIRTCVRSFFVEKHPAEHDESKKQDSPALHGLVGSDPESDAEIDDIDNC